jgi:hypothetical protein
MSPAKSLAPNGFKRLSPHACPLRARAGSGWLINHYRICSGDRFNGQRPIAKQLVYFAFDLLHLCGRARPKCALIFPPI